MAMDDMLFSDIRTEQKAINSAKRRSGRAAAMKAGVEKARAGNTVQLEDLLAEEEANKRTNRKMGSGLLKNAPRTEVETKSTPTGRPRTSRSGGGDYPFTKNDSVKSNPVAKSGVATKVAARAGEIAPKLNAIGSVVGLADAMYQADKATDFKRTKYSGNFGGPSFATNPYSSKASYAGQSTMSKLMGVGKKGK